MSVWLMAEVWKAKLNRPCQWVLMALADHADDEGYNCRPSKAYVAWKTGYEVRQVKRILDELVELGALDVIAEATPRRPKEYRIVMNRVPKKDPFRSDQATQVGGDKKSPLPQLGDDVDVTPGVTQLSHPRGDTAMSPEPSVNHQEQQEKLKTKENQDKWAEALKAHCGDQVPDHTFHSFLSELKLVERRGDMLVLQAPDRVASWVRERFMPLLEGAAAMAFGPAAQVEIPKSETEIARDMQAELEKQGRLQRRAQPRRRRAS